ncbi:MAG: hypothetical protein J6C13_02470 [Clostridia bacterium]|nr:hypothetical protein [Clostridia bacterium]
MSTINYLNDYKIYDFFEETNTITLYKNGETKTYADNSAEFEQIKAEFMETIYNSYEMPAFGVSIHEETIQALDFGTWIKFNFKERLTHNDMPFDALLINISPDYSGINLIREVDGKFEGRCFYINTENTFENLYNILQKIQF